MANEISEVLGRRGVATFQDMESAQAYLRLLPLGYCGRATKSESGKWTVYYHFQV